MTHECTSSGREEEAAEEVGGGRAEVGVDTRSENYSKLDAIQTISLQRHNYKGSASVEIAALTHVPCPLNCHLE